MFEQMIKEMRVPDHIVSQLTDEQRDVLYYEIRQEQIRQYNDWVRNTEPSNTPKARRKNKVKKKNEKRVKFVEGPDGKPAVRKIYFEPRPPTPPLTKVVQPAINGTISIVRVNEDSNDSKRVIRNSIAPYDQQLHRQIRGTEPPGLTPWINNSSNNVLVLSAQTPRPPQNITAPPGIVAPDRGPTIINNSRFETTGYAPRADEVRPRTLTNEPYSSTISIQFAKPVVNDKPQITQNHLPGRPIDGTVTIRNIPADPTIHSNPTFESPPTETGIIPETKNYDNPVKIRKTSTTEIVAPVVHQHSLISVKRPTDPGEDQAPTLRPKEMISDSESGLSSSPMQFNRFPRHPVLNKGENKPEDNPCVPEDDSPSNGEFSVNKEGTRPTSPTPVVISRRRPMFFSTEDLSRSEPVPNNITRRPSPVFGRKPQIQPDKPLTNQFGSGRKKIAEGIESKRQLFESINASQRTTDNVEWFLKSEAPRLMQEFDLPVSGFDLNEPSSNFKNVPKWFHGKMSKYIAENLLRQSGVNGAFLTRVSAQLPGYFLSWFWNGRCHHENISVISSDNASSQHPRSEPSYQLSSQINSPHFNSLQRLVQFYSENSLDKKEFQTLRHAIGQQHNKTGLPDYVKLFYPDSVTWLS